MDSAGDGGLSDAVHSMSLLGGGSEGMVGVGGGGSAPHPAELVLSEAVPHSDGCCWDAAPPLLLAASPGPLLAVSPHPDPPPPPPASPQPAPAASPQPAPAASPQPPPVDWPQPPPVDWPQLLPDFWPPESPDVGQAEVEALSPVPGADPQPLEDAPPPCPRPEPEARLPHPPSPAIVESSAGPLL